MKTITIPVDDNLDDLTVERLTAILQRLASVEWAMLLKFYRAQRYEIHHKGDEIEIKAMVWK